MSQTDEKSKSVSATPTFQLGTSQFTPTPAIETARTETFEPVCLTRKDVAESLRVSVRTVDRLIASGQLPVRRVLGGVRFLRSDIADYLKRETRHFTNIKNKPQDKK
jgi:excisionase family DNA binding protein